jgi:rubrerythrin
MKMHRCRICGETFLGKDVPSNCPFCGAHAEHFVDTADYPEDINEVQLTEIERSNLESSIDLETSNTRFYLAMAARKDDPGLSSAYKRLAKIEAEHCSMFCKLAGVAKPADLMIPSEELGSWDADIDESRAREVRASRLYREFSASATSPRLREVWNAVSAVETDHIELDELAKAYVGRA